MKRRAFIRRTGLTAAVALVAPAFAATARAAAETTPGWQLGCYTRPFDQFDYRTAMDIIAEAGYKHLGLMTTNIKPWVMVRPDTPKEEVAAMHEEATRRSLNILSIYGDFAVKESVEAGIAGLKALIDHSALCGCPNLMLGGIADEKLFDTYYKVIAECCDYAESKKIGLSIKPHGGKNSTGPECRKIIEMVGRKNFRLWYDPGNIFYYSEGRLDPADDVGSVDGLVCGVSIKDFRPPKEVLLNPGTGKVNFRKVLRRLKQGGFTRGPLMVECLERGSREQLRTAARKSREFLEQLSSTF